MVVRIEKEGSGSSAMHQSLSVGKRSLAEDMLWRESPSSLNTRKHVVIVMDALEEFSMEPLQWTLDHVTGSGYTVTLLGVMPWLNFLLSCKTWLDVWTLDLEDLSALKEMSEWKSDIKYQKVRGIIELCDKYGVVPRMKVAMGHPLWLVVLEQTMNLHATWVVFDRHHRKKRAFYAKKIPCNIMMMNSAGEMDMLRVRRMLDSGENTPRESPASLPPIPKVIISGELNQLLKAQAKKNKRNVKGRIELSTEMIEICEKI